MARVIRESYSGGSISVAPRSHLPGVSLVANERIRGEAVLHLTPGEARDLVDLINAELATTPDTRSSASPVAEDRGAGSSELDPAAPGCTQTAPVGAGAAPTGETSPTALVDDPDGHTRTQATGLSKTVTAEPGRPQPVEPDCRCGAPDLAELHLRGSGRCLMAARYRRPDGTARTVVDVLADARDELLANSTAVTP